MGTVPTRATTGIFQILLAVFLLTSLAAPAGAQMDMDSDKFKVGDKSVDFTAADLEGNQVTLSSFQGQKVVLLNFWGLRCGACIEEMPHLNALHEKYKDKGVIVLAVDTDGVDAAMIHETMQELGIVQKYTVLLDQEFSITDTYTNFLVPLNIIIDKAGVIQFIHTGYEKGMEVDIENALKKALAN